MKSPFYIVQEFLSPLQCEQLVDSFELYQPDYDKDDNPIMSTRQSDLLDEVIFDGVENHIEALEHYYGIEYKGTEPMTLEWFPDECEANSLHSENSMYTRGKWLQVHNRALTGVLFLSDYNNKPPFDTDYEVYGGKLEFPQHQFGFNPVRGTLVIYPSGPHFINQTAQIYAGDLYQVRFHIASEKPYVYQPEKFPGDFTTWFRNLK